MKMSFIHFIHNKVWILWITYAHCRKYKKVINVLSILSRYGKDFFRILCRKRIDAASEAIGILAIMAPLSEAVVICIPNVSHVK